MASLNEGATVLLLLKLKDKLVSASFLLIIVFLFASGLALFGIPYLPYESVKAKIDSFAPDGEADFFTVERFKQIRFIGITIFFIGGLLYIGKKQALRYFSGFLTFLLSSLREIPHYFSLISLFSFLREVIRYFKEAVRKEDKVHLFALFLIILIATAVRLFFLSQPMCIDESRTFVQFASKPLYIGLTDYSAPVNHLFHTFLVHISYLLFGNQPWAIRLPALFAGILMVPASYIAIRVFYNKQAALLTAGIVASLERLVFFSTNARGYTLIILIFLLILALGAYLKHNRNPGAWFLFSILSAIGFYTIPVMLYPFGVVMMWLYLSIIFKDTDLNRSYLLKALFVSLIITALLTLVVYTPVFIVSGLKAVIANQFIVPSPFPFFIEKVQSTFSSLWHNRHIGMPSVMSFLLVIGFVTSLVFHKRLSVHRVPIVMAVILWCITILIVMRRHPKERVLLFLLPLYIGLASSGVTYLFMSIKSKIINHRSVVFAILVIIISFWLGFIRVQAVSSFGRVYHESKCPVDPENIAVYLKNYLRPGDIVLPFTVTAPFFIIDYRFEYYFKLYNIPSGYLFSGLDYQLDLESINRILVIVRNESTQKIEELIDEKGLSINNFGTPRVINQDRVFSIYEMKKLKRQSSETIIRETGLALEY